MRLNWKDFSTNKRFLISLMTSVFIATFSGEKAVRAEPSENYFVNVSEEIVTPHIKWAKPYCKGKIKLLVVAPAWGQRETVELMQRFDLDCKVVMTHTQKVLGSKNHGNIQYLLPRQVTSRLDKALERESDVIMIGGFDWSRLLVEHRYKILKKVHEGAGFIYIAPPKDNEDLSKLFAKGVSKKERLILNGIPWHALTAFKGKKPEELVKTGVFGKGRWIALHYRTNSTNQSLTPGMQPWPSNWEYEYYQSLLGKAIVWASKKEPAIITETVPVESIDRNSLPTTTQVTFTSESPEKTVYCQTSFHSLSDGKVIQGSRSEISLTQGKTAFGMRAPLLSAGEYMCNLVLKDDTQRTITWFSFPFSVSSEFKINNIILDKGSYDADEPITGKVILSRPLGKEEKLHLQLWDNHNRLLREEKKSRGETFSFRYGSIEPLGTNIHRLEATLRDTKGEIESKYVEFSIRGMRRPDFHLAIWEESTVDYISSLWYEQFRSLGVDTIFYHYPRGEREAAARLIARADLFGAPAFRSHRIKIEKGDLGPLHVDCMHDPAYQEKIKKLTLDSAAPFAEYDVLFYPSGSDASMRGNCFSSYSLEAFRMWLQSRYASLGELNRIWKTSFSSWRGVIPDTLEKAKKRNNFTSWVEHTRFMETSYAKHHQSTRNTLRTIDEDALMGEDGYGRLDSQDGADWWKLLKVFGFYNLYTYQDPPQLEITRSLAENFPNVKLRSIYYGSYTNQFGNYKFMRLIPWYALFHNYNGLFWWVANGKTTWPCVSGGMVGPDFRPTLSYITNKNEIDEIRKGIVQLISKAKRSDDGIAIFYDQTAVHASTAYSHPSYLVKSFGAFHDLLEDLGFQYNHVVGQQIEEDILKKRKYKVLVMPYALAMSEKTTDMVKEFVRRGGLLIANTLPAKYDYYLRPVKKGSLLSGILGTPGELKEAGSGKSMILKDLLTGYSGNRYEEQGKKTRELFSSVFEKVKLSRFAALTVGDELGIAGLETVTYKQGKGYYLGFLNNSPSGLLGKITVPELFHIYDVKSKRYLGQKKEWELNIAEGESKLFALLPYKIESLKVRLPRSSARRGKDYTFNMNVIKSVSSKPQSIHTFSVEAFDREGKFRPEYCRVITSDHRGKATARIPFALNDPAGTWKIKITETVSGSSAEIEISLK